MVIPGNHLGTTMHARKIETVKLFSENMKNTTTITNGRPFMSVQTDTGSEKRRRYTQRDVLKGIGCVTVV